MRKVERTISQVCKGVCAQKVDPVHQMAHQGSSINNQQKTVNDEIHYNIVDGSLFTITTESSSIC